MGSKNISITLPEEMFRLVEAECKRDHRTRSELVREALRTYFSVRRIPLVEATPQELAAIDEGRRAVARGEYVTLETLLHELDPGRC